MCFLYVITIIVLIASIKLSESQNVCAVEDYKLNSIEFTTRTIVRKRAQPGQFPYQVALFIPDYKEEDEEFSCGGTLISNQFVLTASHCIYFNNDEGVHLTEYVIVILGATDKDDEDQPGQVRIKVSKQNLIPHPQFTYRPLLNDIALIKLSQPIQFNYYIQSISLPSRSQSSDSLVGKILLSSGWGKVNDMDDITELSFMETRIHPSQECIKYFGTTQFINEQHICINSENESICKGDSGGPHVITEVDGLKTVIGISSYIAYYGCEKGYPQGLVRISNYLSWIENHTGVILRP